VKLLHTSPKGANTRQNDPASAAQFVRRADNAHVLNAEVIQRVNDASQVAGSIVDNG